VPVLAQAALTQGIDFEEDMAESGCFAYFRLSATINRDLTLMRTIKEIRPFTGWVCPFAARRLALLVQPGNIDIHF
jgi:hypothetical protein